MRPQDLKYIGTLATEGDHNLWYCDVCHKCLDEVCNECPDENGDENENENKDWQGDCISCDGCTVVCHPTCLYERHPESDARGRDAILDDEPWICHRCVAEGPTVRTPEILQLYNELSDLELYDELLDARGSRQMGAAPAAKPAATSGAGTSRTCKQRHPSPLKPMGNAQHKRPRKKLKASARLAASQPSIPWSSRRLPRQFPLQQQQHAASDGEPSESSGVASDSEEALSTPVPGSAFALSTVAHLSAASPSSDVPAASPTTPYRLTRSRTNAKLSRRKAGTGINTTKNKSSGAAATCPDPVTPGPFGGAGGGTGRLFDSSLAPGSCAADASDSEDESLDTLELLEQGIEFTGKARRAGVELLADAESCGTAPAVPPRHRHRTPLSLPTWRQRFALLRSEFDACLHRLRQGQQQGDDEESQEALSLRVLLLNSRLETYKMEQGDMEQRGA